MKVGRKLFSLALSLVLAAAPLFALGSSIAKPKGFDGKVYDGALALYASSESLNVKDRFICSAQVIAKVKGGYELLSAGHCTPANTDELPSDMTFSVATDLGATLMPVKLVASKMEEPLDYAIYYLPTKMNLPVIPLGDEHEMRIGDKTVDVNFSLALAKEVSLGVVSSQVQSGGEADGFFEVTQFDSHGASGSSVVSERTKKVIGIVIAGIDGATVPSFIEPISTIEKEIAGVDVVTAPAKVFPKSASQDSQEDLGIDLWMQHGHQGSHQGGRGSQHPADNPSRPGRGNGNVEHREPPARAHQGSREHHRLVREHDVRVIGGRSCFGWYGSWFYADVFPEWFWTDDIYMVEGPGGVWFVYDYGYPQRFVQVVVVE